MDTLWEEPEYPVRSGGTASASLRTPADSSEPVIGVTSTMRTPPHYSAGKGPVDEDNKDNEEALGFHIHHHQWDPWQQDEISMSQLGGAPLGTQGDEQVVTRYFFKIPSLYELEMIKIVTNLAYLILAGYEPYTTVWPSALPSRPHRRWLHS